MTAANVPVRWTGWEGSSPRRWRPGLEYLARLKGVAAPVDAAGIHLGAVRANVHAATALAHVGRVQARIPHAPHSLRLIAGKQSGFTVDAHIGAAEFHLLVHPSRSTD